VSLEGSAQVRIESARLRNYAWFVSDDAILHVEQMLALDDVVALRTAADSGSAGDEQRSFEHRPRDSKH
jgi:hypothetical protein